MKRLLLITIALLSVAADKYVSTTGSNANPGTEGSPYLTITHAITQISGGDTIYLRGGVFTNDWDMVSIPSGSSFSAPTTIRNYVGELPVIRPNTAADVFGFYLDAASYVIFSGLEIDLTNTTSTKNCIKFTVNAHHNRITNCVLHHVSTGSCISLNGGPSTVGSHEILNNDIHHAGWQWVSGDADHGIYCENKGNTITGNLIHDNQTTLGHGVHLFGSAPDQNIVANNKLWNNVRGVGSFGLTNWIYNNVAWSNTVAFQAGSSAGHTYFLNNTAWKNDINYRTLAGMVTNVVFENCSAVQGSSGNSGFDIADSAVGATVRYCLSVSNSVNFADADGLAVTNNNKFGNSFNPGFVDALATNFFLLSTSDSRNTALTQTLFSSDLPGTIRPQEAAWDIGAYEFVPVGINAATANVGTITKVP